VFLWPRAIFACTMKHPGLTKLLFAWKCHTQTLIRWLQSKSCQLNGVLYLAQIASSTKHFITPVKWILMNAVVAFDLFWVWSRQLIALQIESLSVNVDVGWMGAALRLLFSHLQPDPSTRHASLAAQRSQPDLAPTALPPAADAGRSQPQTLCSLFIEVGELIIY